MYNGHAISMQVYRHACRHMSIHTSIHVSTRIPTHMPTPMPALTFPHTAPARKHAQLVTSIQDPPRTKNQQIGSVNPHIVVGSRVSKELAHGTAEAMQPQQWPPPQRMEEATPVCAHMFRCPRAHMCSVCVCARARPRKCAHTCMCVHVCMCVHTYVRTT